MRFESEVLVLTTFAVEGTSSYEIWKWRTSTWERFYWLYWILVYDQYGVRRFSCR